MGWPLAVANGLAERRGTAVFTTLLPLAAGHLLAMAVILLPFTALGAVLALSGPIRLAAGVLLVGFGTWRLLDRRHPRFLARIKPSRLVWWSFLMATAHGAGLMLLPFAIGLCASASSTPQLGEGLGTAALVSVAHTAAMLSSGLVAAWVVYRYLGLRMLNRAWINLDAIWGASLVIAGGASLAMVALG
jgi:magnesium-transporting ATPase (P-type)